MPLSEGESDIFDYSTAIDPAAAAPRVWLAVIRRVYALGALAVRYDKWRAIRELTVKHPKRLGPHERNWLRHCTQDVLELIYGAGARTVAV